MAQRSVDHLLILTLDCIPHACSFHTLVRRVVAHVEGGLIFGDARSGFTF